MVEDRDTKWLIETLAECDRDTLLGLRQRMSYAVTAAPSEEKRLEYAEELEMIEAELARR